MKKVLSLLLTLFILFPLFCANGILSGSEEIRIVKTKWFDIVYPDSCERAASLLYDNADRIYEEVNERYECEPSFRLTVTVTDKVDTFNGFNTPLPFNRIVLFNTNYPSIDELSSPFPQMLLNTFQHEVTHAVVQNFKNWFWKGVSFIFGDAITPSYLITSHGMAEGAATSSESSKGNGRLNDEFAKHLTKQAKIEDNFPSYYDLRGPNDTTIFSLSYYFHGAFHQYIINKFGMDSYLKWYKKVINLTGWGESGSFRSVYGRSLREEWKSFVKDYKVPEVIKNPIESGIVQDFFEKDAKESSYENDCRKRFSNLYICDTGLYYAEDLIKDRLTRKIFFVPKENLNDKEIKPQEVLTHQILEGFTVSNDGRYLVLSTYSTLEMNNTAVVKIYDTVTKKTYKVGEKKLKNASLIKKDGEYYLVGNNFNSPSFVLSINKLIIENDEIVGVKKILHEEQRVNQIISNFCDNDDGTFSYLRKDENVEAINISDIEGNIIGEYVFPKDTKVMNMSKSGNKLLFSYAQKDTMPRLGSFDLNTKYFSLSSLDLSGGIFNPVEISENKYVYIARFFLESKLLSFDNNSKIIKDSALILQKEGEELPSIDKTLTTFTDISKVSEKYNTFKHMKRGVIFPFSVYQANIIGKEYSVPTNSSSLPLGLTYMTQSPWNGGGMNDNFFLATAGYSYLTNSFGLDLKYNVGTGTPLLMLMTDFKNEFDSKGWKQSAIQIGTGSMANFGKASSWSFKNILDATIGRQNFLYYNGMPNYGHFAFWEKEWKGIYEPITDELAFNISDRVTLEYSSIVKKGSGRFEDGGFKVGLTSGYVYNIELDRKRVFEKLLFNPYVSFKAPRLIPVNCVVGLTYNLPLKMDLSFMPVSSHYAYVSNTNKIKTSVLDFNLETVLFATDIQKAIPYFDYIYLNNFSINFGYASSVAVLDGYHDEMSSLPYVGEYFSNLGNGKSLYLDGVYLDLVLKMSPNIGLVSMPTGQFSVNLYTRMYCAINSYNSAKSFYFNMGVKANF